MSVEQIVREILVAIQKDRDLLRMLARGEDPQRFTSGDVIFPANRLNELLRKDSHGLSARHQLPQLPAS